MLLAKLLGKTAAVLIVAAVFLFGTTGTFSWPQVWILLLLLAASSLGSGFILLKRDPDLLAQRLGPIVQDDQPAWDRLFIVAILVSGLGWLVLMGLDRRLGWSSVPLPLQGLGVVLYVASTVLSVRVFLENSFAAPVIRVQSGRGQRVIDTGPYAIVRHPLYAVALPSPFAVALLLGSWWGVFAAVFFAVILMIRTVAEERLLRQQLDGYAEYARRVRYRLVPGLW